jgi:bacillithiol biosynthesis cysteine-adding enzyme BshC
MPANTDLSHYCIDFGETGAFSKLVTDYLSEHEDLKPFYAYAPTLAGLQLAIEGRMRYITHRKELYYALKEQYKGMEISQLQVLNLEKLLNENTFTITTAHQPNIFTGPLYFVYKILHAISLANHAATQFTQYQFVPVYYMGSEDADLDELGHIYLDNEKISWDTDQTGAVGRMKTAGIDKIIDRLRGQFSHLPFGPQMVDLCTKAYLHHSTIQEATLYLVHELFKQYGLLVVVPDTPLLKSIFKNTLKKELTEGFSAKAVSRTMVRLEAAGYKLQAAGRELNLFYLDEKGRRERITQEGNTYQVQALGMSWQHDEMMLEVEEHPERFSPNVILRGVFQETILPNVSFVGGGGELAYWLELKDVFAAAGVHYPMLVVRNSFLLLNDRMQKIQKSLDLKGAELFDDEKTILNRIVANSLGHLPTTKLEIGEVTEMFANLQSRVSNTDITLKWTASAIETRLLKDLKKLELKMQRAARRKLEDQSQQLKYFRHKAFPISSLQERIDNFMPYYAQYGPGLVSDLLAISSPLKQKFCIAALST